MEKTGISKKCNMISNMVLCPVCNGRGKNPKCVWGLSVCTECGGFGLLLKEGQGEIQDVETGEKTTEGESHGKDSLRGR